MKFEFIGNVDVANNGQEAFDKVKQSENNL